jgi:hypothetical protein
VGKTANSLLKDGAKIDLKNERKIIRPKPPKKGPKKGPKVVNATRRATFATPTMKHAKI